MTHHSVSPVRVAGRCATLALAILACYQPARSRSAAPPEKPIAVVVADGQLGIQGRPVELPCSRKALARVLGDPSRTVSSPDPICVWDELGVFAHMASDRIQIEDIGIALAESDAEHWPQSLFRGRLEVDGRKLTSRTSEKELAAAKYWNYAPSRWLDSSGSVAVDVRTGKRGVICVTLAPAARCGGFFSTARPAGASPTGRPACAATAP